MFIMYLPYTEKLTIPPNSNHRISDVIATVCIDYQKEKAFSKKSVTVIIKVMFHKPFAIFFRHRRLMAHDTHCLSYFTYLADVRKF